MAHTGELTGLLRTSPQLACHSCKSLSTWQSSGTGLENQLDESRRPVWAHGSDCLLQDQPAGFSDAKLVFSCRRRFPHKSA